MDGQSHRSQDAHPLQTAPLPDGAILLDVYSLNCFNKRQDSDIYEKDQLNGFSAKEKYYGFVNTFRYEQEKAVLDNYTLIEEKKRVLFTVLFTIGSSTLRPKI